jgi:hypothetical protein
MSDTPITRWDLVRAFFTKDKDKFWWNHFTSEEKRLGRMDVWGLAKVINEARVRNLADESEKLIVAEHMLNVRLAKIQASAQWGAGVLGFVGAIVGSALSVTLTLALQSPKEAKSTVESSAIKASVATPVREQREPIAQPPKNMPSNTVIEVNPVATGAVSGPSNGAEKKQPDAGTMP